MMIKFLNLLLTFTLLIAFTPEKSFSDDCHEMVSESSDQHTHCHSDLSSDTSKEKSTKDSEHHCAMACCHLALENTFNHFIMKEYTGIKIIKIFSNLNQNIYGFNSTLFRPPIA
jgi:uncharacterized membrane protein